MFWAFSKGLLGLTLWKEVHDLPKKQNQQQQKHTKQQHKSITTTTLTVLREREVVVQVRGSSLRIAHCRRHTVHYNYLDPSLPIVGEW